jgi:phosphate starvation-inducible PhoH-like protein
MNRIEERKKNLSVSYNINLNDEQKEAKRNILNHAVSFIHGQAGSGKTLLATAIGIDQVFKKEKKKIIITRPTVATEDNGFLPGNIEEKMEPWLIPIRDNMRKFYNKPEKLKKMEEDGDIELVSLTHFRGRTFEDSVIIIDEYQNLTRSQLSMAIGRLGMNSIMIFCGDSQQIDLKKKEDSASREATKLFDHKQVYRVELKENHRHPVVFELLELLK